jgi:hypothetical protein
MAVFFYMSNLFNVATLMLHLCTRMQHQCCNIEQVWHVEKQGLYAFTFLAFCIICYINKCLCNAAKNMQNYAKNSHVFLSFLHNWRASIKSRVNWGPCTVWIYFPGLDHFDKYVYPRCHFVQRGLLCCCCCSCYFCSCWGEFAQNTAFLTNFTRLSAYCITLAWQPCLAALPGSLFRCNQYTKELEIFSLV